MDVAVLVVAADAELEFELAPAFLKLAQYVIMQGPTPSFTAEGSLKAIRNSL